MTPPNSLLYLYRDQGFFVRAFVQGRWCLCPFPELSKLLPQAGRIADLGCGMGIFTNWLALENPQRRVVGFDADSARINVAQKTVKDRPDITFRHLSLFEWDEEQAYDAIAIIDLVHHIPPRLHGEIMRRTWKALKAGGILLLKEVDEKPSWRVWACFLHDFLQGHPPLYQKVAYWNQLIREAGFRLEQSLRKPLLYSANLAFVATK